MDRDYNCIYLGLRSSSIFLFALGVYSTRVHQEAVWRTESASVYVCTCTLSVYSLMFKAFTLAEYLKKRFGGQRLHVYESVLALLLFIHYVKVFRLPEHTKKRIEGQRLQVYMSVHALFLFIHLCFRCLLYQSTPRGGLEDRDCMCIYLELRSFCLFTYVLGFYFTRVHQEEVWWTETACVYV